MSLEDVKETIRAMLRLAQDSGAAEGEIRNATRMAKRLMEEHHLSESEIDLDADPNDLPLLNLDDVEFAIRSIKPESNLAIWQQCLGQFVVDLIGGVGVFIDPTNAFDPYRQRVTRRSQIVFYGIVEDVQLAEDLYRDLNAVVSSMAISRFGGIYRGSGREYAEGFALGLHHYLRESKPKPDLLSDSNRRYLVVTEICDQKLQASNEWVESQGVRLKSNPCRRSRTLDLKAFNQGKSDGYNHKPSANRKAKLPAGGDA